MNIHDPIYRSCEDSRLVPRSAIPPRSCADSWFMSADRIPVENRTQGFYGVFSRPLTCRCFSPLLLAHAEHTSVDCEKFGIFFCNTQSPQYISPAFVSVSAHNATKRKKERMRMCSYHSCGNDAVVGTMKISPRTPDIAVDPRRGPTCTLQRRIHALQYTP